MAAQARSCQWEKARFANPVLFSPERSTQKTEVSHRELIDGFPGPHQIGRCTDGLINGRQDAIPQAN